jgi:hypothetical protein
LRKKLEAEAAAAAATAATAAAVAPQLDSTQAAVQAVGGAGWGSEEQLRRTLKVSWNPGSRCVCVIIIIRMDELLAAEAC